MTAPIGKDASIIGLVDRISRTFSSEVVTTDYWEADLFAIGFMAPAAPGRLVYVNTFSSAPGFCSVILETNEPGQQDSSTQDDRGEVDFNGLLRLIREHLLLHSEGR